MRTTESGTTSDGRYIVGMPRSCRDGFEIRVTDTQLGQSWVQFRCAGMEGMRGARAEILASYQPSGSARVTATVAQ